MKIGIVWSVIVGLWLTLASAELNGNAVFAQKKPPQGSGTAKQTPAKQAVKRSPSQTAQPSAEQHVPQAVPASPQASAPAASQPSSDASQAVKKTTKKIKDKTIFEFDGADVLGERKTPEGLYIIDREKIDFKSQIFIRKNFSQEIIKSLGDL